MGLQMNWFRGRLTELPEDECWELLASRSVGRVAFDEGAGGIAVLPVNYVVHNRTVHFRTAPHSTLGLRIKGQRVAFEIDEIDDFTLSGWNVLLRGRAEFRTLNEAATDAPTPWPAGQKPLLVEITPTLIGGRRLLGA